MFLVWVFWLWLRPLLCCFAVFPAGETQIWPGDLRVVAVWPGFCLCLFIWFCLELWNPRCFTLLAFYLPASLIVRTEPQREIGRQREKKDFGLPVSSHAPNWDARLGYAHG